MSRSSLLPARRRGSVLIVAMLLAAIIAVSLASYLQLANNSLKQASRSFYSNSAMNVAEIGLEQAVACFNQLDNTTVTDAWDDWTLDATAYHATTSPTTPSAKRVFTGFDVGPNAVGTITVYAQHYAGSTAYSPIIVAKSSISQPNGPPIEKYIEVTLRKRSLFANGLVAKDDVEWVGHPSAASWNSDPDNDPSTASIPYSDAVKQANVTVGSLRGDIGLAGGEVWGYAKTGPDGSISGGSVHGLGTTTDDATRRTNDFNATFPTVTTPAPATFNTISSSITTDTILPGGTDVGTTVTEDGVTKTVYYYKFNSGVGINLGGGDDFTIDTNKNVVLLLENHEGTGAISSTGTSQWIIQSGATLNVYTNGNVDIAGNGMVNNNSQPKQCFFWGTRTTDGQTITISGNGQLKAVVYAPNASVTLNGGGANGKMMGSVVAKNITMNGGTEFYYDESLSNITYGNPYGISKWRELQSATERAVYATQLTL
jgi:hypothetical protein